MNHYFCWACDISKNSGEGNLANLFIKKNLGENYTIYTPDKFNLKINIFKKIINYKYISPLVGVFFCWFFFLKKKKLCTLIIYLYGIF